MASNQKTSYLETATTLRDLLPGLSVKGPLYLKVVSRPAFFS